MAEAQARIVDHIAQAQCRYPNGTVAMITHAEIVRAAWLHHIGHPLDEWHAVEIAPASVTRLELPDNATQQGFLEAAAR